MGCFSFHAQDTKRPIYINPPKKQEVTMVWLSKDGVQCSVTETDYSGYGVFGGFDIYEVMAVMNGLKDRNEAITKSCAIERGEIEQGDFKYPQLYLNGIPKKVNFNKPLKDHENQGFYRGHR